MSLLIQTNSSDFAAAFFARVCRFRGSRRCHCRGHRIVDDADVRHVAGFFRETSDLPVEICAEARGVLHLAQHEYAARLTLRVHLRTDDDLVAELRTELVNARHRLFVDADAIALVALPPLGERRILLDALLHDPLRLGKRFAQIRQSRVEHRVLRHEIDEPRRVANAGTCDLLINVASQFRQLRNETRVPRSVAAPRDVLLHRSFVQTRSWSSSDRREARFRLCRRD